VTERPELRGVVAPGPGGSTLTVTVTPRASRNQLELQGDGVLRVRVTAPPVDGAANKALLKFLASSLDIPQTWLTLAAGEGSRHKRVFVQNVGEKELVDRLRRALAARP
jgi:uncharacterized protein (TIGR00251 family)